MQGTVSVKPLATVGEKAMIGSRPEGDLILGPTSDPMHGVYVNRIVVVWYVFVCSTAELD